MTGSPIALMLRPRFPAWAKNTAVVFGLALLPARLPALDLSKAPVLKEMGVALHRPAPERAALTVRFAGVSTLLFDDHNSKWMVDGFFSRPSAHAVLFSPIAPDGDKIDRNLARLGSPRLGAVVPAHSHYDHALDSPEVARKTGALLVGSESTLNIGRGYGLDESQLKIVLPGAIFPLKAWTLTFIASRHGPGIDDMRDVSTIDRPLKPPRRQSAWREGQTWAILVEHKNGVRMLVNASAGYPVDGFKDVRAEVVFIGVGMLGTTTRAEREALWYQSVTCVGARKVIPIHWDDFSRSLDLPLKPMPYLVDRLDVTLAHFSELAARDNVELAMPPAFTPFDPTLPRAIARRPDCPSPNAR